MTGGSGQIIASARQRCATTVRRWTMRVKPHDTITLTVDYVRLARWSSVRVYDSATSTATGTYRPLLLKLTKNEEDGDAARTVVTSGNQMLIEYISVENDVSVTRNNEGFIASYIATDQFTGSPTVRLYFHCIFIANAQHFRVTAATDVLDSDRCQTLSVMLRVRDYLPQNVLKIASSGTWT